MRREFIAVLITALLTMLFATPLFKSMALSVMNYVEVHGEGIAYAYVTGALNVKVIETWVKLTIDYDTEEHRIEECDHTKWYKTCCGWYLTSVGLAEEKCEDKDAKAVYDWEFEHRFCIIICLPPDNTLGYESGVELKVYSDDMCLAFPQGYYSEISASGFCR